MIHDSWFYDSRFYDSMIHGSMILWFTIHMIHKTLWKNKDIHPHKLWNISGFIVKYANNSCIWLIYAIRNGKAQITLVLEGFRTNQTHHSNRVGETDSFGEKNQKVSIILNNANFLNFLKKTTFLQASSNGALGLSWNLLERELFGF